VSDTVREGSVVNLVASGMTGYARATVLFINAAEVHLRCHDRELNSRECQAHPSCRPLYRAAFDACFRGVVKP